MNIEFEPSASFCYQFARYVALPEILKRLDVASGEPFRLSAAATEVLDRHLSPEQQKLSYAKARSEGKVAVGAAVKFFVQLVAMKTEQLVKVGDGFYRLPSPADVSEADIEAAVDDAVSAGEEESGIPDTAGFVYAYTFPLIVRDG